MLGTRANCVEANIATAVPPPWAGWAGGASAEARFPGTQVRRFEANTGPKEEWTLTLLAGSLFKTAHTLYFKTVDWTMSTFCL